MLDYFTRQPSKTQYSLVKILLSIQESFTYVGMQMHIMQKTGCLVWRIINYITCAFLKPINCII